MDTTKKEYANKIGMAIAEEAVKEIDKFKHEAVATITQDHSMAMTVTEMLRDELKAKTKIIKWLIISFSIIISVIIIAGVSGFCYYVWLPETEESITATIESNDKGHAIYGDNGAEVNINGESDSKEN